MRGQTYTLGVLLPDIRNPFFADILAGVNAALERTQYQTLLGISQSAPDRRDGASIEAHDRPADGRHHPHRPAHAAGGDRRRSPSAFRRRSIAHHDPAPPPSTRSTTTTGSARALVVEHLAARGHRQHRLSSASISARSAMSTVTTSARSSAIAARCATLGLGKHTIRSSMPSRPRATSRSPPSTCSSRATGPEAIFCWTDFIALEVLSVARDLGLAVPGDLAVVGYDNTSLLRPRAELADQRRPVGPGARPASGAAARSSGSRAGARPSTS